MTFPKYRLTSLVCIVLKFLSRQLSGNLFKPRDEFAKMESENIRKFFDIHLTLQLSSVAVDEDI